VEQNRNKEKIEISLPAVIHKNKPNTAGNSEKVLCAPELGKLKM